MNKKITITLSDKAEKYLDKVRYCLEKDTDTFITQSYAINHCLEELATFEDFSCGYNLTGFMMDNYDKFNQQEDRIQINNTYL